MRLTIEFADNGIILRNPECEDEVTLAVRGKRADKINQQPRFIRMNEGNHTDDLPE